MAANLYRFWPLTGSIKPGERLASEQFRSTPWTCPRLWRDYVLAVQSAAKTRREIMTHLCSPDVLPASHRISAALLGLLIVTAGPARAGTNVISEWDEKSVAFVTAYIPGPMGSRAVAMVQLAMF